MGIFRGVVRWLFVLGGALVGGYAGRAAAAAMRGESVAPLLRLDRAALMRPDVVPGVLAVELVGRLLRLGPWSAAVIAATAAAAAAFADGPLVPRDHQEAEEERGGGDFGPIV